MKRNALWTMLMLAVAACGGGSYGGSSGASTSATPTPTATPTSNPSNATPAGFVITIQNMGFSPLNLAVPAGATIAVVNLDGMPHSVTSEPSSGSYTRGAPTGLTPFDTGTFSTGQRTITIPANATAGTVIPYYCTVHTTTMTTPNGTITIDPNAKPAGTTASSTTPTGGSTGSSSSGTSAPPTTTPPPSMPAGTGY